MKKYHVVYRNKLEVLVFADNIKQVEDEFPECLILVVTKPLLLFTNKQYNCNRIVLSDICDDMNFRYSEFGINLRIKGYFPWSKDYIPDTGEQTLFQNEIENDVKNYIKNKLERGTHNPDKFYIGIEYVDEL